MSLRHDIQRFAAELEAEGNAAHDLWSWLPSHAAAKAHHGDYASEFMPGHADIMKEAAVVFASHMYPDSEDTKRELEELSKCPCGEESLGVKAENSTCLGCGEVFEPQPAVWTCPMCLREHEP